MKQNLIAISVIIFIAIAVQILSPKQVFAPVGIALPLSVHAPLPDPNAVQLTHDMQSTSPVAAYISVEKKVEDSERSAIEAVVAKARLLSAQSGCQVLNIKALFVDPGMGHVAHLMGSCYVVKPMVGGV